MKKIIFLFAIIVSTVAFSQTGNVVMSNNSVDVDRIIGAIEVPWPVPDMSFAIPQPVFDYTARVLTQEERDSLINDLDFRKKCEWAISDYASYWITHDGSNLSTDARAKWRREYQIVKQVWKGEYNDPVLAKRFVTLAKGRQYNVDNTPTVEEIITLMVADGSFDAIASQYFDMLTQ